MKVAVHSMFSRARSLRLALAVLAGALSKLRYLHTGLSAILVFMGMKMLAGHFYKPPVWVSLMVIFAIAAITVVASLRGQAAHKPIERRLPATALDP